MQELLDSLQFIFWLIFTFFSPAILAAAVVALFAITLWRTITRELPGWLAIPTIAACTAAAHFAIEYDSDSLCLPPEFLAAALGCILANVLWLLLRKTGHAG